MGLAATLGGRAPLLGGSHLSATGDLEVGAAVCLAAVGAAVWLYAMAEAYRIVTAWATWTDK